jgi:PhnB protein
MADDKGVVPHITVENGVAAIEFYKKAFGAAELRRVPDPDGKRIMHAALEINGGLIHLNDDYPEHCDGTSHSPLKLGGSPVTLHMNVLNCDQAVARAAAAGAKVTIAPMDAFWGARYAQVVDPFGHTWALMHPLPQK